VIETQYSKAEYERRFLLDRLPDDVSDPVRIRDRYLHDSNLRLRLVEDMDGNVLRRKLGNKQRPNPADPRLVHHTSIYLDEREHAMLAALPGDDLVKIRYRYRALPGAGVDVVEHPACGAILLEVSLTDPVALELFKSPLNGREVGDDESYTGRGLARAVSHPV
jgi:CYTH domain-containing protein